MCVKPEDNFKIKDPRLNFWGVAYVLPDDANPKCTESECSEDSHCDADRKCCRNYCGGMVCTPTSKHYSTKPSPSCLLPRCENEASFESIYVKMRSAHRYMRFPANLTHFCMKCFARGLALKQRHKVTRK